MTKNLTLALGDQLATEITKAVVDAFGMTFGMKVVPGRYSIGSGAVKLGGDVSGIVGITQERLEGTFTICFTMASMKNIIPRLLGPGTVVTPEIATDAIGEITNMVFNRAKTELNQHGYNVHMSLPTVVSGPSHFINHLHEGRYMLMPFDVEGDLFQVHLAIHRDFG